ncbi:MAG TPA: zf-HC2 domain-containing protein [Bryobacteraceae bacterium]|nr:zf-HC2 domain-containing protein [Bryobacteraceae bacterium]
MSCAKFEPLIALYVERDLPESEARMVEMHLEACPDCREFAAEMRESQAALKSLRTDFVEEAVFGKVRTEVVSRLSTPRQTAAWPRYAVAAMLLMGLCAGWLWYTRPAASLKFQPGIAAIAPPPVTRVSALPQRVPRARVRPHRARPAPAFRSEPLVVKIVTDDPQVVIYWLVDQNGG